MFTGIVEEQGSNLWLRTSEKDLEIQVASSIIAPRLDLGDSVAIDGVCLTVINFDQRSFVVQAMTETLRITTLEKLVEGERVNLEGALRAGQPLGGHFVQGHVDGVGRIQSVLPQGDAVLYTFEAEASILRQLVPKGSICIDGISLTVAPDLQKTQFGVYLIPHTLKVTGLGRKKAGDRVNLETDILGKYILKYLQGQSEPSILMKDLYNAGFGGATRGTGSR